ncbi:hypothetical protein GIB67_027383, partial [Kingdonia uniflora]
MISIPLFSPLIAQRSDSSRLCIARILGAWPNKKDLWVLMLDKSLLKDVRYTKCPPWVYIAVNIKSATSFFQMLYQNRRIRSSNVSSVKIAPWVYIADKIESYLVASIEHLRSKMGSGECEEVLKPVLVTHFGKVVFHGVMGIDIKLELHKMEMNQVHYSVIDMSCLDKNLDLRLMLSTKRILTAQP